MSVGLPVCPFVFVSMFVFNCQNDLLFPCFKFVTVPSCRWFFTLAANIGITPMLFMLSLLPAEVLFMLLLK